MAINPNPFETTDQQTLLAKKFWTVKELSSFVGLAPSTIRRRCSERSIPHLKRGKLLFEKEEILNWLEQGRRLEKKDIERSIL